MLETVGRYWTPTKQASRLQRKLQDELKISAGASTPAQDISICCVTHFVYHSVNTHPSNPRSAICAERNRPRWLERLEELVRLEECLDTQGIQDAKCNQEEQDVLRRGCMLDPLYRTLPKGLGIVEAPRAFQAEFGRAL